mgnify:CR=1 FL=1
MSHENLWAPWRLDYIKSEPPPSDEGQGCFFCRYRDQSDDSENLIVERSQHSMVVLNRFPYNNGHLLVAPLEHKAGMQELSDEELLACQKQLQKFVDLLSRTINADGFNIGLNLGRVAGAGVPGHLHWHIVPRWNGDTNFMPVISDTKVIPQSLQTLYQILMDELVSSE